ncbi:septum formation inhibitor Maf [Crocinitomicaceae bacterium]|nr:septum formation inhibitor Maf [Crocinitomicaceae bacterium]
MKYLFIVSISVAFLACASKTNKENNSAEVQTQRTLDKETKEYWYSGRAEISSYALTQARYGELREGEAVMVFVTEPFSTKSNTKADAPSKDNVNVLKLNFTKRFNTGIYPYSMMNSTFYPVSDGEHSLKASTSIQEWCGHVYMELQNKNKFELVHHSYFEGESFVSSIEKTALEDDVWSQIRLEPKSINTGKSKMIPSFFYLRLMHKEAKAYDCNWSYVTNKDQTSVVTMTYPELQRELKIRFSTDFPHSILSWTETYPDGYGPNKKMMETSGKMIKSIRSEYWNKNSNADEKLREELGLKL